MKTEYQIASSIKSYVTAEKVVTNSDIEIEQIRDEMDSLRHRLLDDLDQQGLLRKPFLGYTQFHKFSTKRDEANKILYCDLPRLMVGKDNKPFVAYVGGGNQLTPYRLVVGNQLTWVDDKDSWDRNQKTVLYRDGQFVFRNDGPNYIWVRGVFAKPRELAAYGYLWKEHYYPVTGQMADRIIGKTVESYLRTMNRVPIQANTQSDNVTIQPRRGS